MLVINKMQEVGLTVSLGEGKRLIKQGAVEVNGELINEMWYELEDGEDVEIKVGKTKEFKGKV